MYAENVLMNKYHCAPCLNLNGGCFTENNYPKNHQHNHCHCHVERIPQITAVAECDIRKFTEYIFIPGKSKGKLPLFSDLGYSIIDSEYLKKEFERQAALSYQAGRYTLHQLNERGQRINVAITLTQNGKSLTVISGWMIFPNGKIVCTTPYGARK